MVATLGLEYGDITPDNAVVVLRDQPGLLIDHVGAALEPAWAEQALAVMRDCPQYRWLGALPHEATRRRIQRAHLLLHPSLMEGGAHVIMEAVRSGTPVLASRVDGNVGMLGPDYAGYFECGDAAGLAELLLRCRDERQAGSPVLHGSLPSPSLLERLQQGFIIYYGTTGYVNKNSASFKQRKTFGI